MSIIALALAAAVTEASLVGAYSRNGEATVFLTPRTLPDGSEVLQFTDIDDGTVRLLRREGEWLVGGPDLATPEPPSIRARLAPAGLELCRNGPGRCRMFHRVPLRSAIAHFESDGLSLKGTVWLPQQQGRYPAVVLAQGSEETNRHGMDPIPQVLASRGFVVFAYDKRGTGESPGSWQDQGIADLATDLRSAFQSVLLSHPEVDAYAAGAIGFSEGPWVAVEAQRQGAGFDFIIAISGGAATKGASLLDKEEARLKEKGLSGDQLQAAMAPHRAVVSGAAEQVRAGTASGFQKRITYDPRPAWLSTSVPVLWMAGEWDVLQDQKLAAKWMRTTLRDARHLDHTIILYPRANHALFEAPSPAPSDWQRMRGIQRYAPGFWPAFLQWLNDRTKNMRAASR